MKFRATLLILAVLLICSVFISATYDDNVRQLIGDEMCVGYKCHPGTIRISIAPTNKRDTILYLTRDGRTIDIEIQSTTLEGNRFTAVFPFQGGFFTMYRGDKNAFMFYKGELVTIHVTQTNFFNEE